MVKSEEEIFRFLKDRISAIDIAMLTTMGLNGRLHSRPMSTIDMDDDGKLWFFTSAFSRKAAEIMQNNTVNLTYSDPQTSTFVTVTGCGEFVEAGTKKNELWTPVLKAWFPDGLGDSQLTLLKVHVLEAEYWDISSSRMVQLFEMARALVSRSKYNELDHEKFNFNPFDV